jgi:hypothetical protein
VLTERRVTGTVGREINLGRQIIDAVRDLNILAEQVSRPRLRTRIDDCCTDYDVFVFSEVSSDSLANGSASDNCDCLHQCDYRANTCQAATSVMPDRPISRIREP